MTPAKRIFDLLLAVLLVVLLAPILAGIWIWLRCVQGPDVFFRSERMKSLTESFPLWKFRTMESSEDDLGVSGGYKSTRVTKTGSLLRRLRLDELPQLWNVLKGDMSFVGPRPPLRRYVERFPEIYGPVLQNRPGITGLATLTFVHHEEALLAECRNAQETEDVYVRRCIPRKAKLDQIYARNRSLCMDCVLLLQTIGAIIPRRKQTRSWRSP